MSSILEILRKCSSEYRKNEEKRCRELSDGAKVAQMKENKRRKDRYHNDPEYREKILRRQRERDRAKQEKEKAQRELIRKKTAKKVTKTTAEKTKPPKKEVPDPFVEHAKKFVEKGESLYPRIEPIPICERAECEKEWCMHFVNGHCVHRECPMKGFVREERPPRKGYYETPKEKARW